MPNVHDTEVFLKATHVKTGDRIKIKTAGVIENKTFVDPSTQEKTHKVLLTLDVTLPNGKEKKWSLNQTAKTLLTEAWGPDTEKWVGLSVGVMITKSNRGGVLQNQLNITPLDEVVSGEVASS